MCKNEVVTCCIVRWAARELLRRRLTNRPSGVSSILMGSRRVRSIVAGW